MVFQPLALLLVLQQVHHRPLKVHPPRKHLLHLVLLLVVVVVLLNHPKNLKRQRLHPVLVHSLQVPLMHTAGTVHLLHISSLNRFLHQHLPLFQQEPFKRLLLLKETLPPTTKRGQRQHQMLLPLLMPQVLLHLPLPPPCLLLPSCMAQVCVPLHLVHA